MLKGHVNQTMEGKRMPWCTDTAFNDESLPYGAGARLKTHLQLSPGRVLCLTAAWAASAPINKCHAVCIQLCAPGRHYCCCLLPVHNRQTPTHTHTHPTTAAFTFTEKETYNARLHERTGLIDRRAGLKRIYKGVSMDEHLISFS